MPEGHILAGETMKPKKMPKNLKISIQVQINPGLALL